MVNVTAKLLCRDAGSSWRASAVSGPLRSQPVPITQPQPLVLGRHLQTLPITPPGLQLPTLAVGADRKPWKEIFLTFATPADKLTTEKASKFSKAVIPLPYSGETASCSFKKKLNPSYLLRATTGYISKRQNNLAGGSTKSISIPKNITHKDSSETTQK